jgi:hypothetical protein
MARLSEPALRQLIKIGETNTVELKVAVPRPVGLIKRVMPVVGFEPTTPHGDLFLRQARIPFRHTGSSKLALQARLAFYPIFSASSKIHRNKRDMRQYAKQSASQDV